MHPSTDLKRVIDTPEAEIDIGRRLAQLRQQRGVPVAALAASGGITAGQLQRIERGATSPAMDLLTRLLAALDCSLARLLALPAPGQSRSWRALDRGGKHVAVQPLGAALSNKAMIPEQIRLSPAQSALCRRMPGEAFLLVLAGRLRVETDHNAPLVLEAGDSLYLDGGAGYRLSADGVTTEALSVGCVLPSC